MATEAKGLTAADLALYLGQEYVIEGRAMHHKITPQLLATVTADSDVAGLLQILLRPLSDLTEAEARECYRLAYGKEWMRPEWADKYDPYCSCLSKLTECESEYETNDLAEFKGRPAVWRYLLSIGIDLFDWIPAGLAIDKTKLSPQP
jgi:hypothetical protein